MTAAPAGSVTSDTFRVRSLGGGALTAVDARSSRSFARHSHDVFGIGLVTRGAQRSWSGRGPVEAIRGNLITVNPGEVHDGRPVGSDRSWAMLYLAPEMVGAVLADVSEGRAVARELHAPVVDDRRLARLFAAAREAALADDGGPAFAERLLLLLGRLFGAAPTTVREPPARLRRVRERIDGDPAGVHPLAALAALAGLSRFQTLRGFARLTGLTPHAYLVQRRLDAAGRLIRGGATPADAAAAAGFADQSHLHRHFVARHGFTPGVYAAAFRGRGAIFSKSAPTLSC